MGLFKKHTGIPAAANPNPARYKIARTHVAGQHAVIEAHYTGCTNYEGRKIIVLRSGQPIDWDQVIQARQTLDPHFDRGSDVFARFEPTGEGWAAAVRLVAMIEFQAGRGGACPTCGV